MRIVRFQTGGRAKYGMLQGETIRSLDGSPFAGSRSSGSRYAFDGAAYRMNEVKLLAPCRPSKIVCVGLNYRRHAEETKMALPTVPLIFLKPPSAVIGTEDAIVPPPSCTRVDYEGELAVVIGKKAKNVPECRAAEYVLGYTCLNDVTERNIQSADGQWTRAKGFDTFAPMGPWIETELAPDDLKVESYLNGQLRQSGRTGDLIFGVAGLIGFISGVMTLLPGDVISTGTPSGIGPMQPGDVVEVRIEGIGTLRNRVAAVK